MHHAMAVLVLLYSTAVHVTCLDHLGSSVTQSHCVSTCVHCVQPLLAELELLVQLELHDAVV
jgi:hypothetical protein